MLLTLVPASAAYGPIVATLPQHHVPPPIEAEDCNARPEEDELSSESYARKGGRSTKVPVLRERGGLTMADVGQGRDLTKYDRLELVEPGQGTASPVERGRVEPNARLFLWEHWRDRRPAYVTATFSSVDAISTFHVFVEPDSGGRWRVAWRIVRHNGQVDDLPTLYAVEWVTPRGWEEPGTPLAAGEIPDSVKHVLQFRDKCGDVEMSF